MKKVYLSPEISGITFEAEDIITVSSMLMSGDHHAGSASSKASEGEWNEELASGL